MFKGKSELSIMLLILITGSAITFVATLSYPYMPILLSLSLYGKDEFWEGFLVNLHNSMFDFLLLVIMVYYFSKKIEEKRRIQSYFENISDVRFLKTEEATAKLIGNINRINENGLYSIDLTKCYLKGAHLKKVKLINSSFMGAELERINLRNAILDNSDFKGASLKHAQFQGSSVVNAKMRNIKCDGTNFKGATITSCDFRKAELINSCFKSTNLKNSDFTDVKFDNSDFERANLLGAKNVDILSLINCKTLKFAKLDSDLKQRILELNPELLR